MTASNALAEVPAHTAPATIIDILERPETVTRFRMITPRHLDHVRIRKAMALATHKTPRLRECHPVTLLGAMQACASLGLEPNTLLQHAFLIPFRTKRWNPMTRRKEDVTEVQLVIGYRGYLELIRRSGMLVSIHADVVYEGDIFEFEYGSNMHLMHKPADERGRPLRAYAHAKLTDGEAFEVVPYSVVMAIRDRSQGYRAALAAKAEAERDPSKAWRMREYLESPWVAFEHEMVAKTMIRRLAKMLPLSFEFANAVALDEMSEGNRVDFGVFADKEEREAFDPTLAIADNSTETEPPAAPVPPDVAGVGSEPPAAPQPGVLAAEPTRPPLFGAEG